MADQNAIIWCLTIYICSLICFSGASLTWPTDIVPQLQGAVGTQHVWNWTPHPDFDSIPPLQLHFRVFATVFSCGFCTKSLINALLWPWDWEYKMNETCFLHLYLWIQWRSCPLSRCHFPSTPTPSLLLQASVTSETNREAPLRNFSGTSLIRWTSLPSHVLHQLLLHPPLICPCWSYLSFKAHLKSQALSDFSLIFWVRSCVFFLTQT